VQHKHIGKPRIVGEFHGDKVDISDWPEEIHAESAVQLHIQSNEQKDFVNDQKQQYNHTIIQIFKSSNSHFLVVNLFS
jgi:hypothetical protein